MQRELHVVTAAANKLIVPSGFRGYDICLNPYVGCQFGCSYCYVRFQVKDKDHGWGEFLRLREHIGSKLPTELQRLTARIASGELSGTRLVIGTMTDPYQPQERQHRLTRQALQIINQTPGVITKVGIYTRSPICEDDLDLIRQLPDPTIHYTMTPLDDGARRKIEPIAINAKRQTQVCQAIKKAGIRLFLNLSPTIPVISEAYVQEFADRVASIKPDEFYIDPMQKYKESYDALRDCLQDDPRWLQIDQIMSDRETYQNWKMQYHRMWKGAWLPHAPSCPATRAIWLDHQTRVNQNLVTDELYGWKNY